MLNAVNEWRRLWQARKWMKQNAAFLPAWHAYVGCSAGLFDLFGDGRTVNEVAARHAFDPLLLRSWVDVGCVVGHLRRQGDRIRPTAAMRTYASASSPRSVGPLLQEMMELHIPTLLQFPKLLQGEAKPEFESERFGSTVAQTSALLEQLAFPRISSWVKKRGARSVLDIGCGHGGYLLRLARKNRGLRLIGIERNKDVLLHAREEAGERADSGIELVYGDFNRWEGPAEPVDVVMMNNILHYFPPADRRSLLGKARSLLTDRGSVTLVTPLYMTGSGQAFSAAFNSFMSSHRNLYPFPTEREVESLARGMGFRVAGCHSVVREGSWYFIGLEQD